MIVLHLTLKKKWFDMIASGEKKEEYRELKTYWLRRLKNAKTSLTQGDFLHFDAVCFRNGYGKNAPSVTLQFCGTTIRVGRKEWGAEPGKQYFVIKLGKIIQP